MNTTSSRFIKKQVVVQAIQYKGANAQEIVKFCQGKAHLTHNTFWIETTEGAMNITFNDWVIKGREGECYPCKPNVFEKTYARLSFTCKSNECIEQCYTCEQEEERRKGIEDEVWWERVSFEKVSQIQKRSFVKFGEVLNENDLDANVEKNDTGFDITYHYQTTAFLKMKVNYQTRTLEFENL